jgi:predicted transcriptional regulator
MTNKPAGTQELRFLQFIAQYGPLSAGQVAEQLGAELGLARSTVLTVMERLRRKGQLRRKREAGVYMYSSAKSYEQVMQSAVGQFVDRALSGSISPFVAYLSDRGKVTPEELAQLREIVDRLEPGEERAK